MQFARILAAAALCGASLAAHAQSDDPDTLFKGKMGGTFGKDMTAVMPDAKRVIVPQFRVGFVIENKVSAQVRASYLPGGIDRSGAMSSYHVKAEGLTPRGLQQVTDAAYATFLKELAASGREVVPFSEVKDLLATMNTAQNGTMKDQNGMNVAFFSPTGMPLTFMIHDGQWGSGGFDLTNYRKLEEISMKSNAAVISPLIIVNFARMSSSGNQSGLVSNRAETGAELGMSVQGMQVFYTRGTEFRNGMQMGGDQGSFRLERPIMGTSTQFGQLQVAAQEDNAAMKGAFDLLGKRMGMANAGGAARSSTSAVANMNESMYVAAATEVLGRMSGSLGAWFRKHPAAGGAAASPATAAPAAPAPAAAPVAPATTSAQ